ncbi:diguanylate cyclase [Desulfoscipio sp. XC116]|uniref:diguanylate cyclase n=1 Tax=Desulfoscipio sp. XC116 TaxID=3144975 RepID=UPI00325C0539
MTVSKISKFMSAKTSRDAVVIAMFGIFIYIFLLFFNLPNCLRDWFSKHRHFEILFYDLFILQVILGFALVFFAYRNRQNIKTGWMININAYKIACNELMWESKINEAVARVAGALIEPGKTEDISELILDYVTRLTDSAFSCVGYIDPRTGCLVSPAMSKNIWHVCQVEDKDTVVKEFGGLWSWVLDNGQPIMTNDAIRDPRSTGVPEGHLPIHRFLSVPVMFNKKLVGQIAVANANREYTEKDKMLAERLATLYAIVVQRKWSDEDLRQAHSDLEARVSERTLELMEANVALQFEINERKRVDERLRESQERIKSIISSLKDVVWSASVDFSQLFYLSPAAESVYGRALTDFIVEPDLWLGVIYPEDRYIIDAQINMLSDQTDSFAFDCRFLRPDGEVRWQHIRGQLVFDDHGEPYRLDGISSDITERKLADEELLMSEARYRAIVEDQAELICRFLPDGVLTFVNDAYCRYFNMAQDELIGCKHWRYIFVDEYERYQQHITSLNLEKPSATVEHRVMRPDGTVRWLQWTNRAIFDEQGVLAEYQSVGHDISDRWWAEEKLHKAYDELEMSVAKRTAELAKLNEVLQDEIDGRKIVEEELRQINEKLSHWIGQLEQRNREMTLVSQMSEMMQACYTTEEAIAVVNRFVRELFATEQGALYLLNEPGDLVEIVADWGDGDRFKPVFNPNDCWSLRRGQQYLVENGQLGLYCRHISDPLPKGYLCVPMMAHGEALGILHLQWQSTDQPEYSEDDTVCMKECKHQLAVTVAHQIALALANLSLRETLHSQAIRDPLTGLFNRRYMEESLDREVRRAERLSASVGLIMFDIDHFKRFNDNHGHDAGDALLRGLGAFLRNNIHDGDFVCRYGGEEFLLILPETSLDAACQLAGRLCDMVKHMEVNYLGQPLGSITISLGVALYPDNGLTAADIVRAADAAVYRAKANGRDQVAVAAG